MGNSAGSLAFPPEPEDGACDSDEDRPWMERTAIVAVLGASATITITVAVGLLRLFGVM